MTALLVHCFIGGNENPQARLVIGATERLYARYGHVRC